MLSYYYLLQNKMNNNKLEDVDILFDFCNGNSCNKKYLDITCNEDNFKKISVFDKFFNNLYRHDIKCVESNICLIVMMNLLKYNTPTMGNLTKMKRDIFVNTAIMMIKTAIKENKPIDSEFITYCTENDTIISKKCKKWTRVEHIISYYKDDEFHDSIMSALGHDKLEITNKYLMSLIILDYMNVSLTDKTQKVYNFFIKIIDKYFASNVKVFSKNSFSKITTFDNILKMSMSYPNDSKNFIVYHIIRHIITKNYIKLSKEHMNIAINNDNLIIVDILIDNKEPFTKDHFHNCVKVRTALSKIDIIPDDIMNIADKQFMQFDYNDILFYCEEYDLMFPDGYIANIKFDEKYVELCMKKGRMYYDIQLMDDVKFDSTFLERICGDSRYNCKDIENFIKKYNLVPTQKCMENACKLKSKTELIKYLLTFGLTINEKCLKNIMPNISTCDGFIISAYLNSINNDLIITKKDKLITIENVPMYLSNQKKRASLFGKITSDINEETYITLSSFEQHLWMYMSSNILFVDDLVKIDDVISRLSNLERHHFINKQDIHNLAVIIYTNAQ